MLTYGNNNEQPPVYTFFKHTQRLINKKANEQVNIYEQIK